MGKSLVTSSGKTKMQNKKYMLILLAAISVFLIATIIALSGNLLGNSDVDGVDEGLLYVYSQTCHYCKNFSPTFEQAVSSYPNLNVVRWDIYAEQKKREEAIKLGVNSTPTVFAVKDGKIVDKMVGVVNEVAVRNFIKKNFNLN